MTHLTIDQCMKLKEWGFDRPTWLSYIFSHHEGKRAYIPSVQSDWDLVHTDPEIVKRNMGFYCPNLEELLDWLGDDFDRLVRIKAIKRVPSSFVAYSVLNLHGRDSSSLQAAYNLALAIHS